ncbi:kinase-like domain-containing protein [Thamnidium elegans]|nr:kinase-like domain-containing protein [Thamnidium elegans]
MSHSIIRNQKAKLASDYNDLLKELASPKLKSIGCYSLGETIGMGSYGKVKLGVHQLTCRPVAIKKISKKHAPLMAREIHHHRQLSHPNIVSLYEILSTEQNIFIVSEHCPNGDLFDALARKKRFSENHVKKWFLQLLDAIQYSHSLGIIHRDLKLENILLDQHNHVKICDFGFARQTDKNQLLKTFCGSLAYSAPEVIQRQKYDGPATDVWSLGVILYTLLAGELPFDDDCESVIQRKVVSIDYTIPCYFSEQVTDLIHKILNLNPPDRATIQDIINHPWLRSDDLVTPTLPLQHTKENERHLSQTLLKAGFNSSTVEKMQTNHVGMLGTLWTMLLSTTSHKVTTACATQTEEQTWLASLKSWFNLNKTRNLIVPPTSIPGAIQQHKFMLKTMIPTLILDPALNTLTPIIPKEEQIINTSSTCSSTADDEFDDDQSSLASSPATSVAEYEEDDEDTDSDMTDKIYYHEQETAFHKVSPMPSRVDVLIPRSRYHLEEQRNNNLRNRLESKMIPEEDEEEEE